MVIPVGVILALGGVGAWVLSQHNPFSSQTGTKSYPPGIAGDPQKEAMYNYLLMNDSNAVANDYARSGIFPNTAIAAQIHTLVRHYPTLSPDTVAVLVSAKYANAQIDELITRFGLQTLNALATDTNKRDAIQYLYGVMGIPGIDKVVNGLANPKVKGLKVQGDLYELEWAAAHATDISQAQLPGPAGGGQQGADFLLNDGTIAQLKSLTWSSYKNSFMQNTVVYKMLSDQVKVTIDANPGISKIEFVFDSRPGPVPDWVKSILQQIATEYHVTITYVSWP